MPERAVDFCLLANRFCADKDLWSVWAAWAQGLGTVAAVFIAVWVGHRQVEIARHLERQREIKKLDAVAAIGRLAFLRVEEAATALEREDAFQTYLRHSPGLSTFHYIERGLEALPLHDLPDATVIFHVWAFLDALRRTRDIVDRAQYGLALPLSVWSPDKDVSRVLWQAQKAIDAIEGAVRNARGDRA